MNEQQLIEKLLTPRYKVIVEDTSGKWEVGDIITYEREVAQTYDYWRNSKGELIIDVHFNKYSHLFQPMPWWMDREELPEYVKCNGQIFNVQEWHTDLATKVTVFVDTSIHTGYIETCTECPLYGDIFPATESEYQLYIQSKK